MSGLKIYSYPHNFKVAKAQIAAAIAGFEIEAPAHKFPEDNHSDAFKKKHNPLGKVPVLETPHGSLFEANAILRYVARLRSDNGLLGSSNFENAQVDMWIDFTANEIEAPRAIWLLPIYGVLAYDEDAYKAARADVEKALTVVNTKLANRTFLVGNGITIADIALATALHGMYAKVFDGAFRARFPHVQRWFETVANQDEFKKFMGPVVLAAAEHKATPGAGHKKAGADAHGKGDKKDKKEKDGGAKGGSGADKPKDAKPKDGAKPKEDKKKGDDKKKDAKNEKTATAAAPAAKDSSEALEDAVAAEEAAAKKKKNPLDSLPESPMILDAVKKLFFSSKPFNPNFWAEFWPKFDANGYTFYTIKYKFDSENTVYFKSCNAMGGFIQRSDDCRKYAFGVVNMTGKDEDTPPFSLNGAWLFRGPEMIAEMKAVDDSEYFEWTKVDTSKPAGRAAIEAMYTGENVSATAGDKLLERRYFK